eukprot:tig00021094_g18111.t1
MGERERNPKNALRRYMGQEPPALAFECSGADHDRQWIARLALAPLSGTEPLVIEGKAANKKEAERLCCLAALEAFERRRASGPARGVALPSSSPQPLAPRASPMPGASSSGALGGFVSRRSGTIVSSAEQARRLLKGTFGAAWLCLPDFERTGGSSWRAVLQLPLPARRGAGGGGGDGAAGGIKKEEESSDSEDEADSEAALVRADGGSKKEAEAAVIFAALAFVEECGLEAGRPAPPSALLPGYAQSAGSGLGALGMQSPADMGGSGRRRGGGGGGGGGDTDPYNWKSMLAALFQKRRCGQPQYIGMPQPGGRSWTMRVCVPWDARIYGEAVGASKKDAEKAAAKSCCLALQAVGQMTSQDLQSNTAKKGEPGAQQPMHITLSEQHRCSIQALLHACRADAPPPPPPPDGAAAPTPLVLGRHTAAPLDPSQPVAMKSTPAEALQSAAMREALRRKSESDPRYRSFLERRRQLPVWQHREDIARLVDASRVVVVCGETGSGKTTQVPQFVFDRWVEEGRGASCRIVVTQPRRISAISVAERIAAERGEGRCGQSVGYQIRLESVMPTTPGFILFCTTGILLRRMQSDKSLTSSQGGVTHVIVDEIHERDLNSDVLLIVLRDLLRVRADLRVVLMSATLDPERFADYFAPVCGGERPPLFTIPGNLHPVKELFLEDVTSATRYTAPPPGMSRDSFGRPLRRSRPSGPFGGDGEDDDVMDFDYDLLEHVIWHIHTERPCEGGREAEMSRSHREAEEGRRRDRDRDRDRDRERGRSRSRERSRDRDRKDRDRDDKDRKRDKEKERDRDRDDKDKERDRDRDRKRDKEKEKERDKDRDKDRERDKDRKRDRERSDEDEEGKRRERRERDEGGERDGRKSGAAESSSGRKERKQRWDVAGDDGFLGAVLVFLPGWDQISKAQERLRMSRRLDPSTLRILPLHSTLNSSDQQLIFERMPPGVRKVVLATNIAETSITVDDVVYVVDFGRHKEKSHDVIRKMAQLQATWISKASARQRAGRAGRVRPGMAYRLYSRARWERFAPNDTPEILRTPLEELVLTIHALGFGPGGAGTLLAKALEPPSDDAVRAALLRLRDLGAVTLRERPPAPRPSPSPPALKREEEDRKRSRSRSRSSSPERRSKRRRRSRSRSGSRSRSRSPRRPRPSASPSPPPEFVEPLAGEMEEELTALGRHLSHLPLDPSLGKALIYGCIFGCLGSVLTIAAGLGNRDPFVCPPLEKRPDSEERKRRFAAGTGSDAIGMQRAFDEYEKAKAAGVEGQFAYDNFLSHTVLRSMASLRLQFESLLAEIGFRSSAAGAPLPLTRASLAGGFSSAPPPKEAESEAAPKPTQPFDPNCYSASVPIVRGVLVACLYPSLAEIFPPMGTKGSRGYKFRTRDWTGRGFGANCKAAPHPSSVLANDREAFELARHRWVVFHEKIRTSQVFLRTCTLATPLQLVLFAPAQLYCLPRPAAPPEANAVIQVGPDPWVSFTCSWETAQLLGALRTAVDGLVERQIRSPTVHISGTDHHILQLVALLLEAEAAMPGVEEQIRYGYGGAYSGASYPSAGVWGMGGVAVPVRPQG